MRTIDNVLGQKNNFDAIRLFASLGVVFSHAYPASQGTNAGDVLFRLSGGQATIGEVCVMVFFVVSGFLITQSFARSNNLIQYMANRGLRIIPALAVVVLLTCFALGPAVTSRTMADYWTNPETYRYLGNCFIYPAAQKLPGVFEANAYPTVVNASLWTLGYEFSCYTAVAAVGLGLRRALPAALLLGSFTILSIFFTWISPRIFLELGGYFLAGSLLYLLRKRIPLDFRLLIVSLVALGLTLLLKQGFREACYLFGAYSVIYIAYAERLRAQNFATRGDLSYGVYVYAFPIQQLIASSVASPTYNFLLSTPLILLCAFISWHLVEKPALARRAYVGDAVRRFVYLHFGRPFPFGGKAK